MNEYAVAKTGKYPTMYSKRSYDESLRFAFDSRLESVKLLLQNEGRFVFHEVVSANTESKHPREKL